MHACSFVKSPTIAIRRGGYQPPVPGPKLLENNLHGFIALRAADSRPYDSAVRSKAISPSPSYVKNALTT